MQSKDIVPILEPDCIGYEWDDHYKVLKLIKPLDEMRGDKA